MAFELYNVVVVPVVLRPPEPPPNSDTPASNTAVQWLFEESEIPVNPMDRIKAPALQEPTVPVLSGGSSAL